MNTIFIRWNDSFNTGIEIMDEQHRVLLGLINSFFFHKNDTDIERILTPIAGMTINYAKLHFVSEENLMQISEYPGVEAHIREHERLFAKLIIEEQECRKSLDADRFLNFLKFWWLDHVQKYDSLYVEHIKNYFNNRL